MDRAFYDRYHQLQERHWWFAGRRRIVGEEARRRIGAMDLAGREPQILDVGCGPGVMLAELSRLGHVRATEMEPAAVRYCHSLGFPEVEVASAPPLPFRGDSFDLVTILDVLEHVDDDAALVADIGRMLRPGGRMLATVPAFPALWGRQDVISHHKRRYVRATLTAAVEAGGLEIERISYFNSVLFAPIAAVRLARRLCPPRGELTSDFEMTRGGPVNRGLAALFGMEAKWLRRHDLPIGVSLLAVAHRGGA